PRVVHTCLAAPLARYFKPRRARAQTDANQLWWTLSAFDSRPSHAAASERNAAMAWFLTLLVGVVILAAFRAYNKYTSGRCRCTTRLDGKVVVVTGANTDLLKKTPSSRIVTVSSAAYPYGFFDIDNMNCEKDFNGFYLYCNSKLCNIFMTQTLAEKLKGTGKSRSITANSLHPGVVKTDIFRNVPNETIKSIASAGVGFFFKNAEAGAQTIIHLAVSKEGGHVSGKYFMDLKERGLASVAKTPGLAEKVWKRSEDFVKLAENERPF
ncbi:hypothetical protein FOCC_FOCC016465, partial [Frankliniella occidentalis]